MRRFGLILALLPLSTSAEAADRGYTVTDFDRIEVIGSFSVTIETGKGPSARATGATAAIDRLKIDQSGRTLRISQNSSGWGGWPGARPPAPTIKITVPGLKDASVSGSGRLDVDRMRAQIVRLSIAGGGEVKVAAIETDRLIATMLGSGAFSLGGKAQTGKIVSDGSGSIKAKGLVVGNLDLESRSAGPTVIGSNKTAKILSTGSGSVTITGKPVCSVTAVGAGEVSCGQ